ERKEFVEGLGKDIFRSAHIPRPEGPELPVDIELNAQDGGHEIVVEILDQTQPRRPRLYQPFERLFISRLPAEVVRQAPLVIGHVILHGQWTVMTGMCIRITDI